MKILNLYAGIGGNRKLWGNEHQITAVEHHPQIAAIYGTLYSKDTIVIGDAHQYLLDHYKEFDFIWSSPPCPSHSRSRFWGMNRGYEPIYPDMKLYEEILFLKHYFKGKYVVENVIPYYTPLIEAQKVGRHLYWSNIEIPKVDERSLSNMQNSQKLLEEHFGIDISSFEYSGDKRVLLRNCVEPKLGLQILSALTSLAKE